MVIVLKIVIAMQAEKVERLSEGFSGVPALDVAAKHRIERAAV